MVLFLQKYYIFICTGKHQATHVSARLEQQEQDSNGENEKHCSYGCFVRADSQVESLACAVHLLLDYAGLTRWVRSRSSHFRTNTICDRMADRSFGVRGVSACGITKSLSRRTQTPTNESTMSIRLQYKIGSADLLIAKYSTRLASCQNYSQISRQHWPGRILLRITAEDMALPPAQRVPPFPHPTTPPITASTLLLLHSSRYEHTQRRPST